MDRHIAVGFGDAGYQCDGKTLWSEGSSRIGDLEDAPKVMDVESMAMADPEHDWRIYFYSPMYEAEYQRQGLGVWVLVRKGQGFA
jgi:hypothetical protein